MCRLCISCAVSLPVPPLTKVSYLAQELCSACSIYLYVYSTVIALVSEVLLSTSTAAPTPSVLLARRLDTINAQLNISLVEAYRANCPVASQVSTIHRGLLNPIFIECTWCPPHGPSYPSRVSPAFSPAPASPLPHFRLTSDESTYLRKPL